MDDPHIVSFWFRKDYYGLSLHASSFVALCLAIFIQMWLNIDGFLQKKKEKEKIAHAIPVEETPRIVLEDDPYEILSNIFGESEQEISTTAGVNRAVNISLKRMVHCILFRLWWLWRVRWIVIFH